MVWIVLLAAAMTFPSLECAVTLKSPEPKTFVKEGSDAVLVWEYTLTNDHVGKFNQIQLFRYKPPDESTRELMASSKGIPLKFSKKVTFKNVGSFTLFNVTEDDVKWSYHVVLSFDGGKPKTRSKDVKLALKVDVSAKIRGDGSLVYEEGEEMQLICDVTGTPLANVTWYKKAFENSTSLTTDHSVTGTSNYTATASTGTYICRAYNVFTTSSSEVDVLVRYFRSVDAIEICETESLCCPATGFPPPAYQWTRPNGEVSSVNERCLQVTKKDIGNYTCKAENSKGQATISVTYCTGGNVTTHTTGPVLKWKVDPEDLFYTVYGTDEEDVVRFIGCGQVDELALTWNGLDLRGVPKDKKRLKLTFEVRAQTKTKNVVKYRAHVDLDSKAGSLQADFLGIVFPLVFGLLSAGFQ